MIELNEKDLTEVNGGGAWDDFWQGVGRAIGNYVANASYNQHSKEMFDKATNGGLQDYLDSQNDPLL